MASFLWKERLTRYHLEASAIVSRKIGHGLRFSSISDGKQSREDENDVRDCIVVHLSLGCSKAALRAARDEDWG